MFIYVKKEVADKKKTFTGLLEQCKQKQDTSLVYITKICKLCILLITDYDRLLNFDLSLKMHYLNIVKQKHRDYAHLIEISFNLIFLAQI